MRHGPGFPGASGHSVRGQPLLQSAVHQQPERRENGDHGGGDRIGTWEDFQPDPRLRLHRHVQRERRQRRATVTIGRSVRGARSRPTLLSVSTAGTSAGKLLGSVGNFLFFSFIFSQPFSDKI